jgi:hypothetical protein
MGDDSAAIGSAQRGPIDVILERNWIAGAAQYGIAAGGGRAVVGGRSDVLAVVVVGA